MNWPTAQLTVIVIILLAAISVPVSLDIKMKGWDIYVQVCFAEMCLTHHNTTSNSLTEIDECLNDPCDANATCTNTAGSYTCECNLGFSGSGINCTSMFKHSTLSFSTKFSFIQISMSVKQETTPVIVMLPALTLMGAMSVNAMTVTQEMEFHVKVSHFAISIYCTNSEDSHLQISLMCLI